MISSSDFSLSLEVLHRIVQKETKAPIQGQFSPEFNGQGLITTALKIIHKASLEGTSEQRKELSQFRHEIIALNSILSQNKLTDRVQDSLNVELGDEAVKLENSPYANGPKNLVKTVHD